MNRFEIKRALTEASPYVDWKVVDLMIRKCTFLQKGGADRDKERGYLNSLSISSSRSRQQYYPADFRLADDFMILCMEIMARTSKTSDQFERDWEIVDVVASKKSLRDIGDRLRMRHTSVKYIYEAACYRVAKRLRELDLLHPVQYDDRPKSFKKINKNRRFRSSKQQRFVPNHVS